MIKIARRDPARKEWFPKIFRYLKSHKLINEFQCHIAGSYADLIHGYDVHAFGSGDDVDIVLHSIHSKMNTNNLRSILLDIEEFGESEFNAKFDVYHVNYDLMNYHRFFSIHQYETVHGIADENKTNKIPEVVYKVSKTIEKSKTHLKYKVAPHLWKIEIQCPSDNYIKKVTSRKEIPLYQKRLHERGAWVLTDIHNFDIKKWEEEHCATSSKNK
tara:strand:- start:1631 stop:2275 length:645 start_codon:yes stop_codon:yes gene_type:complete